MDSTILRVGESGEFVLKRAVTGEDRLRCWNLVYREYLDMGYAQPNRLAYRYSVATLWPKMPGWSLAFPGPWQLSTENPPCFVACRARS